MKKFILMMGVAAFMAGCFEESTTQASSVAVDEDLSFDSSSSKKSSKSSSSKQVKSSSSKMGKSSSSTNKIALQSSSSIKVIFTINSSSSVALPTIIPGSESSSSQQPIEISDNQPLSSMAVIIPDPGSSASEMLAVTGLGSCKPTKNPIDKGTSTTWTFVPNPAKTADSKAYGAMAFAQATYAWNFGDLSEEGAGISTASGKVTYASSGKFGASVTVSVMNRSTHSFEMETVACEPLQVNGDPITGCKCTAGEAVVDFLATPMVTWTVSGCTSNSTIVSYEWNGVAGTTAFTQTFTSAANAYAPTLRVANDDNTIADVACDAVKVTEGPEYEILDRGDYGEIKFPAGNSKAVLKIEESRYFYGHFSCKVNRYDSPTGYVNGSVNGIKFKGSDFVSMTLPSEMLTFGAVLEIELDVPATCSIQ